MHSLKTIRILLGIVIITLIMPLIGVYAQEVSCEDICSHPQLTVSYEECLALATFYVTQGGVAWTTNTNWTTSPDVSTWRGVGVATGNDYDTVTDIVLPNNGLSGALGSALTGLPSLKRLDLQHNHLTSIDTSWANMTQLEEFTLAHNDIQTLPDIFGNWGVLDVLRVEGNQLSTLPASIGQLYELDMLDLSDNTLTSLPASIGNLDDLDILKVARNQLTVLPNPISDLAQLSLLDAQGNMLTVWPAQMEKMINLESLQLQHNRFTTIPAEVFSLPALYYLNMRYNVIETLPGGWEGSPTIQLIDLGNNRLSILPEAFATLNALKQLYLHNNVFTAFPEVLFSRDSLELLGLGLNYLEGDLPAGLSQLHNLTYLDVSFNRLTHTADGNVSIPVPLQSWIDRPGFILAGQGQSMISESWLQGETDLPALLSTGVHRIVTLHPTIYGQLTNPLAPTLIVGGENPLCEQLQVTLQYAGSGTYELLFVPQVAGVYAGCTLQLVTAQGDLTSPWQIPTITMVTEAQAAFCEDDEITVSKETCLALLQLYVSTNGPNRTTHSGWFVHPRVHEWYGIQAQAAGTGTYRITGLLLHSSSRQAGGSLVQGQGNGLQGVLPDIFDALPDLQILSLGNNLLTGKLPISLGRLAHLEELYVQKNKFTGQVGTIGGLHALRRLGLQGNDFEGSVQDIFSSFQYLEAVDVRDNRFSGGLPMFHEQAPLRYVNLAQNDFGGPLPEQWASYTTRQHLAVQGNDITGMIPVQRAQWSGLTHIDLGDNALDREVTDEARLSQELVNRWQSRTQKNRSKQRDIQAPVISFIGNWVQSGTNTYVITATISENNYAVNAKQQGMPVFWGGGVGCDTLTSPDIRISSGSIALDVTVPSAGLFEGCTLTVLDHGKNFSLPVSVPLLSHDLGDKALCLDQNLSIPREECFALRDLYVATNGDSRTNTNNRWQTPYVDRWFGVQTALREGKQHVTALLMHRNELTSLQDTLVPSAQGNNLSGTLPDTLRNLPYLEFVRMDGNSLSGTPRDALVGLDNLKVVTLSHNTLSDQLPTHWGTFPDLELIDLSFNAFTGPLPSSRKGLKNLKKLLLGNNLLSGTVDVAASDWGALEELDLSFNAFTGTLDGDLGKQNTLQRLLLNGNTFIGSLPVGWSSLSGLIELDLANNKLTGPLPTAWQALYRMETFALSGNTVFGDINSVFPFWGSLHTLDISGNKFTGRLGEERTDMQMVDTLRVRANALDRTEDHLPLLTSGLATWVAGLTMYDAYEQRDMTPPKLRSSTTILSPVQKQISWQLSWEETSYPLTSTGRGLAVHVEGPTICSGLLVDTSFIATGGQHTGTIQMTLAPLGAGTYTCWLSVTDHGGNVGRLPLTPFWYPATCGNGSIGSGETCDEGRFCETGEECTNETTLCPFTCSSLLVDNCTPSCFLSRCGDAYLDQDGTDNSLGTQDDEICDVGSYCPDGRSCTTNPDICFGGSAYCLPRSIQGCSPLCAPSSCGDGYLDEDGVNDILDDHDDEDCDDGNTFNGDGCGTSCKVEYCGDGFIDANGADNISGSKDDELCDVGVGNGLRAGLCNQFCQPNAQTCQWCYETCQGGTGQHSIYLLIDVSGSMEGDKMEKAKQGAKEFVQRILSGAAINSGFTSKVGIIKFSSNGTVVQTPTTNYQQIITAIDQLSAGGSTNFGDPLYDAKTYFDSNDLGFDKHIVLLSDGLPTVGTRSLDPETYATQAATALKESGVHIYTIAVEQTEEGIEFMRTISSSALHNTALGKMTTQSSTQSSRSASRAIDTDKDNYTQTKSDTQAWWQVDLGTGYSLRELKVRNRSNMTSSTSNVYVFTSSTPFTSTTVSGTLAQSGVTALFITGTVARPTIIEVDSTVRYVRVQLGVKNSLQLAEVEVMGCIDEEHCDFIFNFEDYTSEIISTLYGHIFGSIHCGCGPYQVCGTCGDGTVDATKGESCDEGSTCDDGTDCTTDPTLCPTECRTRTTQTCTLTCSSPFCGDGVIQTGNNEQCDDANTTNGDGCASGCTIEQCGDGVVDSNGADNILGTNDDEQCDDANTTTGDGCAGCQVEFCGDGVRQSGELCDLGRSCNDGTDCTTNPWVCPTECKTRFVDGCSPDCTYGTCGDLLVDSDGANNTSNDSDDEQCDPGKFCPNGIPCTHDASLCPGACTVQFTPTCTEYCKLTYCGDGFVDLDGVDDDLGTAYDNEQCDDENAIDGDGCSASCLLEDQCVGGECTTPSCGDGTKQFFEQCDPTDTQDSNAGSCTDACKLSQCGDGIVWSNEACDTGKWCDDGITSCTHDATVCPTGPTECRARYRHGCTTDCQAGCGDKSVDNNGVDNIAGNADDEQCDDGNTRATDSCTNTCHVPTCGDGILTYYAQMPTPTGGTVVYYETCDDGNTDDGDACPSTCIGSGTTTIGVCGSSLSASMLYNNEQTSLDLLDQACEKGVPDGSPVYDPLSKERNRICHGVLGGADASCTVSGWSCGDGILDVWQDTETGKTVEEQCDDGNATNGDGCTASCMIESPLHFPDASCAHTPYPTIQLEELLPIWWEGTSIPTATGTCATQTQNTLIDPLQMQCIFGIYRSSPQQGAQQVGTIRVPCLGTGGAIVMDARDDAGSYSMLPLGGALISAQDIENRAKDTDGNIIYGQYRLALNQIEMNYCAQTRMGTTRDMLPTPVWITHKRTYTQSSLCAGKRSLIPGYLMQQRILFSEQPNTGLDTTILNISGESLYIDDSSYHAQDTVVAYGGSEKAYLFTDMRKKYEPLATESLDIRTVGGSSLSFAKVPNVQVYVYSSADDLLLTNEDIEEILQAGGVGPQQVDKTPFTLLLTHPNADLRLQGDISGKGMYVAQGDLWFVAGNCDTQDVVQGLFVTNGSFGTTSTINSSPDAHVWCNGGGLVVQGLLLGGNISETLGGLRRSTMNVWENEHTWYATSENPQYMTEKRYKTCFDMPLLYDAIKRLYSTSITFGGPFVGCDTTTLASFEQMRGTTEQQIIDLLFKPQGFFDKGFHEQNTSVAKTLLSLLPQQTGGSQQMSTVSSLTTTILYKENVYTLQIPSWKLQEIVAKGKTLPVFWSSVIDLRNKDTSRLFWSKIRTLVDNIDQKITHGEHPLQQNKTKSIHDTFTTVWGSAYVSSLLSQASAGSSVCNTSTQGVDGNLYPDNQTCRLTYTPFYTQLISQYERYQKQKQQKDTMLLEGAGVQIRTAPALRQTPPPGARDLLQAMQISF